LSRTPPLRGIGSVLAGQVTVRVQESMVA
jgi:hypothetical protein